MPRADARGRRRGAQGARTPRSWLAALVVVSLTCLGACTRAPDGGEAADRPSGAPTATSEPETAAPEEEAGQDTRGEAAPTAGWPDEPATPEPASRPALTADLERTVAAALARAPEAELGVLVLDEAGREVVAHQPDRPLLPASTVKQVTAAAALTTLGPGRQLRTVVDATAGIDGTGRLDGDLIVVGSGDPTLVTEEYARFIYPARPHTPLASLADQLVAAGLTHVTGDVHGVAPAFAPASLPTGWRDEYLSSLDGRYAAGLTVDGGLRTILELPDVPDTERSEDDAGPEADRDEEVDEEADDEAAQPPLSLLDQLAALETDLPPTVRVAIAPDPALHATAELTRLLEERGVVVDGGPTVEPPRAPSAGRLASVASPPLADVLRFTLQRSDNHLADALALAVGRARTGEGSWSGAERALVQVLERFGVPTDGAVFADGSGLSRDDRVTPRLLAELDRRLTGHPRFGAVWRTLQAVSGRSGTLQRRLVGTPAEGRLLAKTGTLRDVTSLSGQVIAADADPEGPARADERRYHLAVIANGADAAARAATRAATDEIVLALAADLDGCRLVPGPGEDGPLGRPLAEVACPD